MNSDLKFPQKNSLDLAYICGFIIGDGHLCLRQQKNEYHIVCTGNLKDEKEFYENIIIPIFNKLFGINFKIKISKRDNTINIIYYSKKLLEFFSEEIGIPTGSKSDKVTIPELFKRSNILFKYFLQGYADADFCFCLKKRYSNIKYYPVISCSSRSSKIIEEITEFLDRLGFTFYKELNKPKYDKRLKRNIVMSSIILYGHYNLIKWVREIGFRNFKSLRMLELWRERNIRNPYAKKALL